jgi:hypothetical protein
VREAVGQGVELGVGEALALENDRGALGMFVDRRFDVVAYKHRRLRSDSLQPAQGAQERPDKADLALCTRDQS